MSADIQDFYGIVIGDVARAQDDLRADPSPYRRRTLIRTIFSGVEGLLWELKSVLARNPERFNPAELLFLTDEAYAVDNRGNIKRLSKFTSLEANIRAVLKLYQSLDPSLSLNFSGRGWSSLGRSLATRHRITHPRNLEELNIAEDEVADGLRAFYWFLSFTIKLLQAHVKVLESETKSQFTPGEAELVTQLDILAEAESMPNKSFKPNPLRGSA